MIFEAIKDSKGHYRGFVLNDDGDISRPLMVMGSAYYTRPACETVMRDIALFLKDDFLKQYERYARRRRKGMWSRFWGFVLRRNKRSSGSRYSTRDHGHTSNSNNGRYADRDTVFRNGGERGRSRRASGRSSRPRHNFHRVSADEQSIVPVRDTDIADDLGIQGREGVGRRRGSVTGEDLGIQNREGVGRRRGNASVEATPVRRRGNRRRRKVARRSVIEE